MHLLPLALTSLWLLAVSGQETGEPMFNASKGSFRPVADPYKFTHSYDAGLYGAPPDPNWDPEMDFIGNDAGAPAWCPNCITPYPGSLMDVLHGLPACMVMCMIAVTPPWPIEGSADMAKRPDKSGATAPMSNVRMSPWTQDIFHTLCPQKNTKHGTFVFSEDGGYFLNHAIDRWMGKEPINNLYHCGRQECAPNFRRGWQYRHVLDWIQKWCGEGKSHFEKRWRDGF